MAETPAYIAIDWGTTNRRVHAVSDAGRVVSSDRDDRGVLSMAPGDYPADIAAIRARHGDLPVLAAGMVGSTRGWVDVPYAALPAGIDTLAAGLVEAAPGVSIVPGLARRDARRADVMRGEEVQVLGAVAAGLAPADALFCQPGTHNKWITTSAGRITDFTTAMTGEIFALLRGGGILSGMLDGVVADGPAFRDGLARGHGCRDLTVALFEVRAGVLLGAIAPEDAASFASGILIGADVGAQDDLAGRDVHLLASGALADLYAAAIAQAGGRTVSLDSDTGFVSGIHALWEYIR